jgi:hypothetical protein
MPPSTPYDIPERAAELIAELARDHRLHVALVPVGWTDDQCKRLSRSISRVLEAGEPGLRTIEDALHG